MRKSAPNLSPKVNRYHLHKTLAEGVISEPFLPSGDQGCKGGFATPPKQPTNTGRITYEIPAEIKSFLGCFGRKTGR
jgi:hypothetical protein